MKKQEFRDFEEVIKAIASAESDVDRVLEAARLVRHERESRKLSAEQKMTIICIILGIIGVAVFLGFIVLGTAMRYWR